MGNVFRYELGARVRDVITGFEGIITARSDWLNGCVRYLVSAERIKEDGNTIDLWVDEPQLKFLAQVHEANMWPADPDTGEKPKRAGPRNDPPRR